MATTRAGETSRANGFSVRGVHFRSPAEARASARRLRSDADEHATAMRREGNDTAAEKVVDQANEQADAYDLAAAEHDTNRTRVAQRPAAKRGGSLAPTPPSFAGGENRSSGSSGGGIFGGVGSAFAGKATSTATGSAGDLVEQLVMATIAVAFLTVFLSSSRGPGAFGWLATGSSKLLQLLLGASDPLAGLAGLADSTSGGVGGNTAALSAGQEATLARATGLTPQRRKQSPVVVTTGGVGRHGGH